MPARVDTRVMNAFLTTTLQEYIPTLQDNVFDDVPMLSYLNGSLGMGMSNGEGPIKMSVPGGDEIVVPLLYGKNTTAGSYSGGETLATSLQDGITNAKFPWKHYSVAISLLGAQARANRGKHQLLNLLQAKTTQAELTIQELLNEHAYLDGSGNNDKNLDGLAKQISLTATTGGLAPATHAWWKPSITSAVGTFSTSDAGVKAMRTKVNTLTIGNKGPNLILTTQTIYEEYEQQAVNDRQVIDTRVFDAGFRNLTFKGIPMLYDRDCPAGEMYFLNSNNIKWAVHTEMDMEPSEFVKPYNQDLSTSLIMLQANTVINNRRRLGKLEGITV